MISKKLIALLPVLLFCKTPGLTQPCAADVYLRKQLEENPALYFKKAETEQFTQQWIAQYADRLSPRVVITIPIVVHVVWKQPEENISEAQILSQIEVLNQDFRALNQEITGVPAIFRPAIADAEIEFCLATRDPEGKATNGITRTQTTVDQFNNIRAICYANSGGHDAWNPDQYLNIWVGNFGSPFIGEASFPGMSPSEEDGVRVDFQHFGTAGTAAMPPYNLGRTATHEVGHYFNLYHPWGAGLDNPDCSQDDEVADTPRQSSTFKNECPVHPQVFCGTASMFMNFMNYTDDACMAMFTKGQKARMLAALAGPRAGLPGSSGCLPPVSADDKSLFTKQIRLLQNPVQYEIKLVTDAPLLTKTIVRLLNMQGQLLFSDTWNHSSVFSKNVDAIPSGIYLLVLQNETNIFTKKIIITH